jgi:hypothetical protein
MEAMTKRSKRGIATALVALSAVVPATASARTLDDQSAGNGDQVGVALSEVRPSATSDGGFAWDDAGIGAGAVLLVLGVGAGFAGSARARRGRRLPVAGS